MLPRSAPPHLINVDSPFSETARKYLKEACESLHHEAAYIRSKLSRCDLPHQLVERLRDEDRKLKHYSQEKLSTLCRNSIWGRMGRTHLITNISTYTLTPTQEEALSLGFKFGSGINKKDYIDYAIRNFRYNESGVDKGIKQGIVLCCAAAVATEKPSLPRRYVKALKELKRNENIVITTADKGGVVVITDYDDYTKKMEDLVNDDSVYIKQDPGLGAKEATIFNKTFRRILNHTERGKKLLHLLEEAPKTPTMRGLPKVHKPGIPLMPITSGVCSAPHRLAKTLAKPLSAALGKISGAHLKKSADLKNRLQGLDISGSKLISFDVKSLFTNVPVDGALSAVEKILELCDVSSLPVSKGNYLKTCVSMCEIQLVYVQRKRVQTT